MAPHAQGWLFIGKSGLWQARQIYPFSDGNARHWPGKPPYRPSSEERYLINVGNEWAKKDGIAQPGVNYYLDKLPNGYALFEQDQPGGPNVYKRLFGHPSGKYFDSSLKFGPHFLWLMTGMQGTCDCVLCSKGKPRPFVPRRRREVEPSLVMPEKKRSIQEDVSGTSSRSNSTTRGLTGISSRPQRQIRATGAPYALDIHGNEDVYKELIKRLYNARDSRKGIEDDITEPNNMDWRATHEHGGYGTDVTDCHLTSIERQHSFTPRIGELVMWIPNFMDEHHLMLDENSEYKFYSLEQECFHGHPSWRAGVIAEVPSATALNGQVDFTDIVALTAKKTSLNTSGFRVETFPDPNDEVDKSASKQYRYVPLRNIRPLSHWNLLLRGIPQQKWHSSITNALTCMTSMSLLEKFCLKGDWPNAHIRCKGIFLGPELIIVGDTVRLRPENRRDGAPLKCTDVMVVDQIRFNLIDIKPEYTLADSAHLATKHTITLKGRGYTLDIYRSYQLQAQNSNSMRTVIPTPVPLHEVKTVMKPVGTGDYGSWYYLHDPTKRYEISHDMVLGRLYEAGAVQLWTGQLQTQAAVDAKQVPSLSLDIAAIAAGRQFASQKDLRLDEVADGEIRWYFGEHRADALDLEIFNGQPIGRYEEVRSEATQEEWRNHLKVLNGHPVTPDLFKYTSFTQFTLPGIRGRKPGSKVINGKVIRPGQPGYDDIPTEELPEPQSTPKHKNSSQLAGAALVSSDEDGESEQDEEGQEIDEQSRRGIGRFSSADEGMQNPDEDARAMTSKGKQREPLTKAQIMSSVEQMVIEDDFSEDDWFEQPLPLARGGTEESEGGDYRPNVDAHDD